MAITDWPEQERPREKLLAKGASALSDAELLAIFLRTGTHGLSAVELARTLLIQFGDLHSLFQANQHTFCEKKGLGNAKYAQLQAVLEMSRRYLEADIKKGDALHNPKQTQRYLQSQLQHHPNEVFAVLFLDSKNRILKYQELFYGSINSAAVYPREILRQAIHHNAASLILAHNHPSGTPQPSQHDIDITQKITTALKLIDIRTLDHIIVGHNQCFSFAEQGLM